MVYSSIIILLSIIQILLFAREIKIWSFTNQFSCTTLLPAFIIICSLIYQRIMNIIDPVKYLIVPFISKSVWEHIFVSAFYATSILGYLLIIIFLIQVQAILTSKSEYIN